jgi:Alpha-2,8-polysialyltransferase (POLYST)
MSDFKTINSHRKYHVFFTYTPFNQLIVNALLDKPEFKTLPVLIVNTFPQKLISGQAQIINFFDRGYTRWQLLKRYRSIAATFGGLRERDQIASITCPHPHNMLSNDLMLGESDFPVYVYEDGVANYCASNNVGRLKRQSRLKAIIAPVLGFNFRDYSGHITGLDQRAYQRGYFLSPAHVYRRNRFDCVEGVDFGIHDQNSSDPLQTSVLVLDQDIEKLFNADISLKLRARLSSFVEDLGVKVYVKPHPGQNKSRLAEELGSQVILVNSFKPAELIALELRPKYVVSFVSSALKNIAGIMPDVKCYSFGVQELDEQRDTGLTQVFRDFNVEVC